MIEGENLESADLYYNIGNTYFKLDDIAHAILYYERALKLDPAHADARHNLEIATQLTLDRVDAVPDFILVSWFRGVRQSLSADTWAWLTLALQQREDERGDGQCDDDAGHDERHLSQAA